MDTGRVESTAQYSSINILITKRMFLQLKGTEKVIQCQSRVNFIMEEKQRIKHHENLGKTH